MNKKQKEQAYKEFEEMVDDIWHKYCSQINNGTQDVMFLEDFSDASKQLIDKTIQQERERVVAILKQIDKEKWSDATHCTCLGYATEILEGKNREEYKRIIPLITNNSDIKN